MSEVGGGPPSPGLAGRDLVGGAVLVALGLFGWWMTADLPRGTLRQFGPGMMPQAVSVLIAACGVLVAIGGLRGAEPIGRSNPRALVAVLGAVILFGVTIRGFAFAGWRVPAFGLAGAVPLAMLVAGLAVRETNWRETAAFAVALTIFAALIFRYALGLPIPLAPWLFGY